MKTIAVIVAYGFFLHSILIFKSQTKCCLSRKPKPLASRSFNYRIRKLDPDL